ncbi:MAG: serine/threonine-protein kinase [Myxococcales bacterium]
MAPPPANASFGKYELLATLGSGGMAELFLARERERPELLVVIKRVLPELTEDLRFVEMLLGEAKVASLLDHPGIVRILELGQQDGRVYLAMEYVPGWNTEVLCEAAGGRLPPEVAARIGLAVAEALAHAHRQTDLQGRPLRLVHRDVTPENVMVTPAGEVKLIDFGIAKAATQLAKTAPRVVKGKLRFMSPEQARREPIDARSDLYSLGVALYELSTGVRPFDRPSVGETIDAVSSWDPPRPRQHVLGYPEAIERVVLKALEKEPNERFADAESMARALAAALGPGPLPDLGGFVRDLAAQSPLALPELPAPPVDERARTTPAAILSEAPDDAPAVTTARDLKAIPPEILDAVTEPRREAATRRIRLLGDDAAATISESQPVIRRGRSPLPRLLPLVAMALAAAGGVAWVLLGR